MGGGNMSNMTDMGGMQSEVSRLRVQLKALTERDVKNKLEMQRWWAQLNEARESEKEAKEREAKVKGEYAVLERKHDTLQIKYLALADEMKEMKEALKKMRGSGGMGWEEWSSAQVSEWCLGLEGGRYGVYAETLEVNVKSENIDGRCLSSLD